MSRTSRRLADAAVFGDREVATMRAADIDAVMDVEARVYPFPWTRGNFIDSLVANHLAWCLVDGRGELLAYAVAMAGVEELHLLNLTVANAQRRRGHARFLMNELAQHARGTAARTMWLEVRPSNGPALALYASLGYERIGVRRQYYPDVDSRREDAWVMRLDLTVPGEGSHALA
jgi:ribosomal-protein-alanine N-acetyltransferase